jgi:SAM-dependent methyltransferase
MRKSAELKEAVRERAERRVRTMAPGRRLRFQLALDVLERKLDGTVELLDAGCGEGLFTVSVASRHPSWRVVGVDLSDEGLARARSATKGMPNVRILKRDLTTDLGANRYDAVAALECLEEIPDDDAALLRMSQALRAGGLFVAHVPEAQWTPVLPRSARAWRHEVRHGYTREELTDKLANVGLDMLTIVPTTRGTVGLALEIRDRIKTSSLKRRLLAYPGMVAAVRLERLGLTWGPPRGLLIEARRQ